MPGAGWRGPLSLCSTEKATRWESGTMLESLKLRNPLCEKITACFRSPPASHVERGHKLLSLVKLLDSVPESAGKELFSLEASGQRIGLGCLHCLCPRPSPWGGDQRDDCWSWEQSGSDLPLSKLRSSLQTPFNPSAFY